MTALAAALEIFYTDWKSFSVREEKRQLQTDAGTFTVWQLDRQGPPV